LSLLTRLEAGSGNMIKILFEPNENIIRQVRKLPFNRPVGDHWVTFRRHVLKFLELCEQNNIQTILDPVLQDFVSSEIARIESLGRLPTLLASPIELQLKLQLAPFQNQGARFLGLGNKILADETGVGKTAQAFIGALAKKKEGIVRRILIVAPAKVKKEWANQIEAFTDATYVVVGGTPKKRIEQLGQSSMVDFTIINYDLIKVGRGNKFNTSPAKREIELPSQELEVILNIGFDLVIFDEVTYAMNRDAKRTKGADKIARKAKFAWGLSGTPLMNNLMELFNVVRLIDPTFFGGMSWGEFAAYYTNAVTGEPIKKKMPELHKKLAPIMLRRLKQDVLPELPPLVEMNRYATLAEHQGRVYRDAEKELKVYLGTKVSDGTPAHLVIKGALARLTRLKQISAHPRLVGDVEEAHASGKLDLLKDVIANEIPGDDKFIVFTQFEKMTRILEEELKEYGTLKIVGGMSERATEDAKKQFREDPTKRIMLLTTAGGMGLNLQTANWVILYDQLYNPQMMKQITDRAHRNGQKKKVSAIWLWTEDTVEERIWAILKKKKNLFDVVIEGKEEEALASKLTLDDMRELMK